jgi:hypothetical protein
LKRSESRKSLKEKKVSSKMKKVNFLGLSLEEFVSEEEMRRLARYFKPTNERLREERMAHSDFHKIP